MLSDDGGWLTAKGKDQAAGLGEHLRDRRVAAVYTSTMTRAVSTGAIVGEALTLTSHSVPGLQEFSVGRLAGVPYRDPRAQQVFDAWLDGDLAIGCPGGETGLDVVRRFEAAISELTDLHPPTAPTSDRSGVSAGTPAVGETGSEIGWSICQTRPHVWPQHQSRPGRGRRAQRGVLGGLCRRGAHRHRRRRRPGAAQDGGTAGRR